MAAPLCVEVEFGGGAELLFDGVKKHQVTLPGQEEPWDIRNLLVWIKTNLLKERPELFIQGDSVRPGILVLINDADWELLDRQHEPHTGPAAVCQLRSGRNLKAGKPGMIDWRILPADTGHPQRRRKEARMRMAAPVARTFVPSLSASLGPLCWFWDLPVTQGVSQSGPPLCGPRPPSLLRPELNHRCPATILGWPQTRTRIAFGQSVVKPLSSGLRSPSGFCLAP
uniref:Ubiquitin-related modifier 1 n=2 Tax=Rattus norvegicus TaxID=10116 RepID=A0ABK0M1J9_RAT